MLEITHTETDGTLLDGTSRTDGAGTVLKTLGWRWSRALGLWYIPRSRDTAPRRALIEQTARQLREAHFEVEISIDTTIGDRHEAEERRTTRSLDRAARLTQRADREQRRSDARYAASKTITDHIPLGQPILLGHHSQRRAERDAARVRQHMDASLTHQRRANRAADAARTAAAAPGARHNPVTVANRIERLATQIRQDERHLTRYDAAVGDPSSLWRQTITDRLAIARADLDHWTAVRASQISTGQATNYSRDTVQAGDLVKIRGQWQRAVRCNPKTITVTTGYSWTDRVPWHEVQAHKPTADADTPPKR